MSSGLNDFQPLAFPSSNTNGRRMAKGDKNGAINAASTMKAAIRTQRNELPAARQWHFNSPCPPFIRSLYEYYILQMGKEEENILTHENVGIFRDVLGRDESLLVGSHGLLLYEQLESAGFHPIQANWKRRIAHWQQHFKCEEEGLIVTRDGGLTVVMRTQWEEAIQKEFQSVMNDVSSTTTKGKMSISSLQIKVKAKMKTRYHTGKQALSPTPGGCTMDVLLVVEVELAGSDLLSQSPARGEQ